MSDNIPPPSSSSIICKCCGAELYRGNSLLEEPNFVSALKKLLEQLLPLMMVTNVRPVLEPMMQTLVHNAVTQPMERGLDLLLQRLNARAESSEPRKLALKFSGAISSPVYTGKDVKGIEGNTISISLVDAAGKRVNSGVEASSNVEIMVVADDQTQTLPLLSRKYLNLKDGVAVLDKIRFKCGEKWTKKCEVKLVARILGNSQGSTVEDAKTESFPVYDSRTTYYRNREIPLLSDNAWRLKEIGRERKLHKCLRDANIETVEQLLVSANTDPQSLQQILDVSPGTFKVILDHAQKSEIPADRYIHHGTVCEGYTAVVFDVVGRVLGLVRNENRRFVPADDLNEDEKVAGRRMVKSAFSQRKDLEPYYDNETSTSVHDFPSHDVAPPPSDHFIIPFLENDLDEMLGMIDQLPGVSSSLEYPNNPTLSLETEFGEFAANLGISPQCSGLAKGRWKRVVKIMKFMSKWKRIVAPADDTRAHKKQKCG